MPLNEFTAGAWVSVSFMEKLGSEHAGLNAQGIGIEAEFST